MLKENFFSNKQTLWAIVITVAVLVVIYFAFLNNITTDVNQQKTEETVKSTVTSKDNSNEVVAPEKKSSAGDKMDPSEPRYFPGGPQETGVYSNGQSGYNLNVSKYDLLDEIQGTYGVTKTGTYFCLKSAIDEHNFKNPLPVKVSGYFSKNSQDKWVWQDVSVEKAKDGREYYVYHNDVGPVSDINDNILFCYWYYGSNMFYPHEGVKTKNLKVASKIAL